MDDDAEIEEDGNDADTSGNGAVEDLDAIIDEATADEESGDGRVDRTDDSEDGDANDDPTDPDAPGGESSDGTTAASDEPSHEDGSATGGLVENVNGDSPARAVRALADRIEGAGDDESADALADDARAIADRVEAAIEEVENAAADAEEHADDLESKLKRKQAEFENYKKRAERKREEIRERATEEFVERVVSVRDNLVRALDQDEDADIRDGLQSTLSEFDDRLEEENVEILEPEPGDEVDPVRHEVLMRAESDRLEGTVVDLYRPGYEMAGRVIQTAQVTVSDGSGGENDDAADAEADDGDGSGDEE